MAERPRGLGIAAGLDEDIARELARRCEPLGYASLWSNDHPMGSGLETVAVFADAAPSLDVGVAVMALDRHEPAGTAAHMQELGIPHERLWLGIGAVQLADGSSVRGLISEPYAVRGAREITEFGGWRAYLGGRA